GISRAQKMGKKTNNTPRRQKKQPQVPPVSAITQVREHWPELFDLEDVKPLAIGIDEVLYADARQRELKISYEVIQRGIKRYCQKQSYHQAMLTAEYRRGLGGSCIPVQDSDRQNSKRILDFRDQQRIFAQVRRSAACSTGGANVRPISKTGS
ncbi:MAG: ProQ/FINO family protein, partial [Enterobacteriaceae bacterium]